MKKSERLRFCLHLLEADATVSVNGVDPTGNRAHSSYQNPQNLSQKSHKINFSGGRLMEPPEVRGNQSLA